MDDVFRALADPTRRELLDELFREDGQTLSALEARFDMTRFGVMKHLRVLEDAGLVVPKRPTSTSTTPQRADEFPGGDGRFTRGWQRKQLARARRARVQGIFRRQDPRPGGWG